MCIIDKIIEGLQNSLEEKEIFLSEADLQFCFAQEAKNQGAENIVLEYPIKTSELYKRNELYEDNEPVIASFGFCGKDIDKDKTYIDVKFEYNNEIYFVELKYKTTELDCITRHGYTDFKLFEQSACNLGLYAIYEDIERMENIIEIKRYEGKSIKSYILAITNECGYWNKHNRGYIQNVSLENGKQTLKENCISCEKSKEFPYKHIAINKDKNKDCGRPICLKDIYEINWKVFKSFSGKEELCKKNEKNDPETFGYLKIDLREDKK